MTLPPFQELIDAEWAPLARFLRASLGADGADDALQETLLAALGAYPRLSSSSNVRAWLFTIARNKATDQQRARARRPAPVPAGVIEHAAGAAACPDGGRDDELWDAVRALPPKQSAAVTLRYAGDLSHREIAAALGCSEAAARRSVHEGLTKLREEHE